jgi:hypothetical protein
MNHDDIRHPFMNHKYPPCLTVLLIWCVLAVTLAAQPVPAAPVHWKPNKVLLVVGSQWADPNGDIIDGRHEHPHHPEGDKLTGPVSGDTFWRTAAFLKACSIPFDILRLDQMELRLNYFLDHHLQPAYGAVVWDVDASTIPTRDFAVMKQVVADYGISLITLTDRRPPPEIQELLGLQWDAKAATTPAPAPYHVAGGHYITRGSEGDHPSLPPSDNYHRPTVTTQAATVLATAGGQPALTVREVTGRASAIWIGGDPAHMLEAQPFLLRALRRAVVHGIGYSVYRTFPHTVVFRMDDPTCTAMFKTWHFPALTEQEIVDWIVKPLQERNAVLQLNMVPGRFMDATRRIEPNWTQDYTDEIGERHDLVSNGRGWRRGIDAGVFEVQSHGWTHRNPHWEKYWAAGPIGRLENRWGGEFYDRLGHTEVPNAMQLFSLKRSRAALEEIWGQRPLYFVPGQNAESFSHANHTARLARKAGFAITQDFWLGRDFIINVQPYLFTDKNEQTSNVPGLEGERPILILSHDIDVYRDHDFMRKRLAGFGPEYRFIGVNEPIAYLFAEVRGGPAGRIEFRYDPETCRHFATHGSSWELHLSDHFRGELNRRGPAAVAIDGKPAAQPAAGFFKEQMEISLPAGVGSHSWEIRPWNVSIPPSCAPESPGLLNHTP